MQLTPAVRAFLDGDMKVLSIIDLEGFYFAFSSLVLGPLGADTLQV